MPVHYTRERTKYGTLTGSIIVWPVELASPNNPNNIDNAKVLPAGYLRCDGSKYKAADYPLLAEVCGTGPTCKFAKLDQNGDPVITIGTDEFVVPDLGSKFPRPVSGGDAGVFNNIIEQTKNNTFIKRSGMGVDISSNVGSVATVTYSGSFIVPAQTIPLKGKPKWTWGTNSRTDPEAVENAQIHPHMHFSNTTRVRLLNKGGATGGVVPLPENIISVNDPSLNPSYNGTAFVGYGSGTGESGGFASPGYGSGYVAFGGAGAFSEVRRYSVDLTNTNGNTLITITSIVGNDANGGERPNNPGEGIYVIWPDGTKSSGPLLPARQESGLGLSSYDSQYANWRDQSLTIPEQYRTGTFRITLEQIVRARGTDANGNITLNPTDPAGDEQGTVTQALNVPNAYDMAGVVRIGLSGGFTNDPTLSGNLNDTPAGINYFKSASTININSWLNATKARDPNNNSPGSGQPACWAMASGNLAGSEVQDTNPAVVATEVIQRYNFCNTGCSFDDLRCYCLLKDGVTYDLTQNWFGIEGTRYNDYTSFAGSCGAFGFGVCDRCPWPNTGTAKETFRYPAAEFPVDWKGLPLDDVLPINSYITSSEVYPQATNVYSEVQEVDLDGDPTIHDHKIEVTRGTPVFSIVTNATLIEPDNLNTTLQLTPSTIASIDVATSPFIVVEYLIKT
jgi:hypothetical protein